MALRSAPHHSTPSTTRGGGDRTAGLASDWDALLTLWTSPGSAPEAPVDAEGGLDEEVAALLPPADALPLPAPPPGRAAPPSSPPPPSARPRLSAPPARPMYLFPAQPPAPPRSPGAASRAWALLGATAAGRELQALLPMATPVMVSACLNQLLNIVDLLFVGNFLGPEYLAAATLGNCWFNILSALFLGGASGIDQLCSVAVAEEARGAGAAPPKLAGAPAGAAAEAEGEGDTLLAGGAAPASAASSAAAASAAPAAEAGAPVALLAQRGLLLMALSSLPLMVGLYHTEGFLVALGQQDTELSSTAAGFCDSLMLGLLPQALSTALTCYLSARGAVWPVIFVNLMANILNITLNTALIEVDGFLGAPLATSVARVAHLVMLCTYMAIRRSSGVAPAPVPAPAGAVADAAPPPRHFSAAPDAVPASESGAALFCAPQPALLHPRGLAALGGAMAAGAATVALESWPLEVSNLVAGLIDVPSLDAHAVVLNVCVFISLGLPTGLAVAASARIPALLAAGDGAAAKRTALVAVLTTATFNLVLAFAMLAVRGAVGAIFTPSKEVAALCARAVLLAALFQVADGLQCVMGGVLRALGWGRAVTALLFACWAGVGLPVGGALAVGYGQGVTGLWAGLVLGVGAVALAFAALLHGVDWDAEAAKAKRIT